MEIVSLSQATVEILGAFSLITFSVLWMLVDLHTLDFLAPVNSQLPHEKPSVHHLVSFQFLELKT